MTRDWWSLTCLLRLALALVACGPAGRNNLYTFRLVETSPCNSRVNVVGRACKRRASTAPRRVTGGHLMCPPRASAESCRHYSLSSSPRDPSARTSMSVRQWQRIQICTTRQNLPSTRNARRILVNDDQMRTDQGLRTQCVIPTSPIGKIGAGNRRIGGEAESERSCQNEAVES